MENKNIYIGHRYVPKIIGVHDSTRTYEGLSIVTHEGTSYTSKKYVPEGVSITNDEFWVVTGNYNVQVEHYRNEVNQIKKSHDSIIKDISDGQINHDNLKNDYEKSKVKLNNLSYGVFNVLDYNMTIDGTTDNTNDLKTIINDISENGGGILEIPYHTNDIITSESLYLPSNITINGNGNTIKCMSTKNETTPLYFVNKENIYINNLNINGMKELKDNQISASGGSNGITFSNQCRNIVISNCHIYNTLEHGISFLSRMTNDRKRIEHCENIVVDNCLFENNGNKHFPAGRRGAGIMCYFGVLNIKIVNNTFKDFVAVGNYIDSAYSSKKQLEEIAPNLRVDDDHYMGDNTIINGNTYIMTVDHWENTNSQAGVGIVLHGQKKALVSNNIINLDIGKYRGMSISNGQEDSNTRDILVVGNRINVTNYGIEISNSQFVKIFNNYIRSINEVVIYNRTIDRQTHDIYILNNVIENTNTKEGIFLDNLSEGKFKLENIFINDNIINFYNKGNNSGIYVKGGCKLTVAKNNTISNGIYGIRLDSLNDDIIVTQNTIIGCNTGVYAIGKGIVEFNTFLNCEKALGLNTITPSYNVIKE